MHLTTHLSFRSRFTELGQSAASAIKAKVLDLTGGPARLQIIVILAAVLAIETIDKGTVSAVSDQLKSAFKIGNTEVGLLLGVVSFVAAIATLPAGVLADRIRRKTILIAVLPFWTAAMIVSGTASSYLYLLITRLFLGVVTAAAWPCIASLTGDFFPAQERAGIYGLILGGELVGTGIGFFVSGEVSSIINWRWAFYVLSLPALAVAWIIWKYLPEPARGTQAWIEQGERDPGAASGPNAQGDSQNSAPELSSMQERTLEADTQPRNDLVLSQDPTKRNLVWVIRYLLKLPTYRLLIAITGLIYYFFSGISMFGMIYFTGHYQLSRTYVSAFVFVLGAGAVIGVVSGGRISERLFRQGKLSARLIVPSFALFLCVPFFAAGFWTRSLWLAIPLLVIGAGSLGAAVAPVDAARLDIVHPRMWGRSESGRTALRSLFEGGAPLLFGAVSGWLGGGDPGLMWTFILMLVALLAAGGFSISARNTYPRDVATAAASVEKISQS